MTNSRLFVAPLGEYGSPLGPDDYAGLERSWISREIAISARIRRVTSEEGKEIVGRRDFEGYAGLLFPYLWPGRPGVFAHRIRRDNPPYEIRNGLRKQRDKYMSAPGWGNALYFHPLTPPFGAFEKLPTPYAQHRILAGMRSPGICGVCDSATAGEAAHEILSSAYSLGL